MMMGDKDSFGVFRPEISCVPPLSPHVPGQPLSSFFPQADSAALPVTTSVYCEVVLLIPGVRIW